MKRANKDGKLNGMFDIHIAVPKMGWERLIAVQLSLHPIIPKFKYFVEVKNFGYDAHYPWTRETSAKDHDLEEPGAMATVKVGNGRREETYTAAQQKIRQAMTILEEQASLALTFYQADRRSVLEFGQRLEKAQDRLRCDDVITEQVCIVGERKG